MKRLYLLLFAYYAQAATVALMFFWERVFPDVDMACYWYALLGVSLAVAALCLVVLAWAPLLPRSIRGRPGMWGRAKRAVLAFKLSAIPLFAFYLVVGTGLASMSMVMPIFVFVVPILAVHCYSMMLASSVYAMALVRVGRRRGYFDDRSHVQHYILQLVEFCDVIDYVYLMAVFRSGERAAAAKLAEAAEAGEVAGAGGAPAESAPEGASEGAFAGGAGGVAAADAPVGADPAGAASPDPDAPDAPPPTAMLPVLTTDAPQAAPLPQAASPTPPSARRTLASRALSALALALGVAGMLDAFMFHMTGDGAIALCLAGVVLSVVSFRLLPRRAAGRRLAMLALVVCLPIPMITALLLAFLLVMALPSLF